MTVNNPAFRGVWLAIITIGSFVGAVVAFAIFLWAEQGLAASCAAGGATFAGLMFLGFGARQFLAG
ncbi:hypothetical protein AB0D29_02330 [Streptomyces sp. NPDC048424]|uniref:hypothetical protein n=1 Tax=Streptomyces sp. NPDC048424 TaxID=3155265 RepID=UPI00342CE10E